MGTKVIAALTAATPARIPTTAKKSQSRIPMPLSPTAPSPITPQRLVVEPSTPPTPDSEYCDVCCGPCLLEDRFPKVWTGLQHKHKRGSTPEN